MTKFDALYKKSINEDIDDLIAAPGVLTPAVTQFVLNLMAQKEGTSVEAYLAVAKEALGIIGGIEMTDEDLAEKLVQRTLNSMSPENVDKIVSLAAKK
jgi:hypothetical protein